MNPAETTTNSEAKVYKDFLDLHEGTAEEPMGVCVCGGFVWGN